MKCRMIPLHLSSLIVLACLLLGMLVMPSAAVFADQPTPIPTQMSNTLLSVDLSRSNAKPGDTFDIAINIETDRQTWGLQFSLHYDPALVELSTAYEPGGFYKDYADANNGTLMVIPEPSIDNTKGLVKLSSVTVVGLPAGSGGPTGKGTVITLHGKVKDGANGTVKISLADILVSDAGNAEGKTAALGGVKVRDAQLVIGSGGPAPTMSAIMATEPGIQSGPTPTLEPTIAKRTSLDNPDSNGQGGNIPWIIILPVIGVIAVGGGAFFVLRKK
ncbi:MAG TPA: cohesin domain-containing protein [Anaerolineaceae bacterium]|nr:cohesin domain-containing protein [Anaerolineaceae bacterium]